MRAGSGFALKALQIFLRSIEFACASVVFALYSYFLATLHNHSLDIDTYIRAVEGITGFALLYTALAMLFVCCMAGHPFAAGLSVFFDIAFVAAFIYVASANRGGAGSCTGTVSTPFGTGSANTQVVDNGHGGFTKLPSLGQACRMESACLAVSIVAIFFFIFSAINEVALYRHRRKESRFGPSPANDYTSGYGKRTDSTRSRGLFGFLRRGGTRRTVGDANMLPEHTHPDQIRESYATEQTRVNDPPAAGTAAADTAYNNNKYGDAGFAEHAEHPYQQNGYSHLRNDPAGHAMYPPGNYQYEDGVYTPRP